MDHTYLYIPSKLACFSLVLGFPVTMLLPFRSSGKPIYPSRLCPQAPALLRFVFTRVRHTPKNKVHRPPPPHFCLFRPSLGLSSPVSGSPSPRREALPLELQEKAIVSNIALPLPRQNKRPGLRAYPLQTPPLLGLPRFVRRLKTNPCRRVKLQPILPCAGTTRWQEGEDTIWETRNRS